MAYGKYKDLTKRTESDKDLEDKAFKIASNPKYDGYKRGLASMVYMFFDRKSTDQLQKPIIIKFKRHKVYSSFKDNIWNVCHTDITINKQIQQRNWVFIKFDWYFLVNMYLMEYLMESWYINDDLWIRKHCNIKCLKCQRCWL